MVHANVDIALVLKPIQGVREHDQLVARSRQIACHNSSLRLEALGQMGIGINGQSIGTQGDDLIECAIECRARLLGQSINQIHVDGVKPERAGGLHQGLDRSKGLNTVHGLLHQGLKVLHAKADAVKPQGPQVFESNGIDRSGVDFNGEFGLRGEIELAAQSDHQLV